LPAPQYTQMSPRPNEADDTDDAALLRRVADGDRDALGALYRRHAHVVLAQIRLAVGEPGLSEEILQDTMLAVWRGAGSFRGVSQVRSWIIAIALRQARDRLRRRRVAVVADESVLSGRAAADPGPEAQVLERAELAVVAQAIRSLSPAHREVLGLVFGADLTLADAAEVLGVPVGTVKSRLPRPAPRWPAPWVERELGDDDRRAGSPGRGRTDWAGHRGGTGHGGRHAPGQLPGLPGRGAQLGCDRRGRPHGHGRNPGAGCGPGRRAGRDRGPGLQQGAAGRRRGPRPSGPAGVGQDGTPPRPPR
jgi:RNA polymerase sigma-70 factor, ECF subfamily